MYKTNKRKNTPIFILSWVLIILGGIMMRFAWVIIKAPSSPYIVIGGAVIFLTGVVLFAVTLFNRRHKY